MRKKFVALFSTILLCGLMVFGHTTGAVNSDRNAVCEYGLDNVVFAAAAGTTTAEDIVFGDVNGDGSVNNKDLGLLQRHIAGWDVEIDVSAADMNGDGNINNKDLGLLQRYISGWEVELPTTPSTPSTSTTTTTTTTTTGTTTRPPESDTPDVILPEEGYTPDGRIKLGAVSLSGHTVTMVIRNVSSVWESEDGKSYFEYTCYDENDDVLLTNTLAFGYIPVKSSRTFTFDIPENTVKVVLTDFSAEYWSVPV